jgi:hypothetical protein
MIELENIVIDNWAGTFVSGSAYKLMTAQSPTS